MFQECQKKFFGADPLTHSSRTSRKRKPNPFLQLVYYIFITETNSNLYTSENYKFIQYPLPFFTISILFITTNQSSIFHMQLFQNILVSIALLTQVVFAIEITENKVDRGTVTLNLGDITIYPGVSWSIIDNAYTNFVGKLDVRDGAGLYISLTSHLLALQVSLTTLLHSITNNGVVSFDSRISRTSSSYDLRGVSFTNNGEMYFAASGEFSSSTALTSALWTNTGLLLFYQNQRTSGTVSLGMPLGSITNNGQVCLNNQVYEQTTQIKGSGCFTANGDSTIYISNVLLAVSPNRTFT